MTAKRIAVLCSHSAAGGAGEIMANIAEGLRALGHDVTLHALYPVPRSTLATRMPWNYVVPVRPTKPVGLLRFLPAMVGWLRRDRPDIVVSALPAANIMAAVGARLAGTGTKVITTHHSPVDTHHPVLDRIDGRVGTLSSVADVVSVSDTVARSLEAKPNAYREKRRTIHNALPPAIESLLTTLADRRAATHVPGRRVMAIGRLADQKNYPVLIRAARHLPDVQVAIAGRGDKEDELRALAVECGVADRVTYVGHHPREDTLAMLADADVFVQMSLFEGHSLALIEAAKLGLPLLVSDVPVQVEGVTAADGTVCGVVIPLHDDEQLAKEIRAMLDDPQRRRRFTDLSHKLAAESHFDTMVAQYDRLIALAAA